MGRTPNKRRLDRQAADWAIRLADGDLSSEERRMLMTWTSNPAHATALRHAAAILGNSRLVLRDDADFARENLDMEVGHAAGRKGLAALAVLALLCLGYIVGLPLRMQADFVTAVNETRTVTLPDGSRVRLDADSALAEDFDGAGRRVRLLKGQAYFEVAKDASRPFLVDTRSGEARALGTAFDVNLTDDHSEVTVIESHVLVSAKESKEETVLAPGERVTLGGNGKLGLVSRVPSGLEAPWLQDRLIFEERPLSSVVEEIFRRLPGKVVIARSDTGRRLISGSFDLKNPEVALKSFGDAMNLRIIRAGPFLTVIY